MVREGGGGRVELINFVVPTNLSKLIRNGILCKTWRYRSTSATDGAGIQTYEQNVNTRYAKQYKSETSNLTSSVVWLSSYNDVDRKIGGGVDGGGILNFVVLV